MWSSVTVRFGLRLGESLKVGENVVARGSEARRGEVVLKPRGRRLGAAEIALAAACGCAELEVFARPAVAIVATGDELVELDQAMEGHQIRNSNGYALAAMVEAAGGDGAAVGDCAGYAGGCAGAD